MISERVWKAAGPLQQLIMIDVVDILIVERDANTVYGPLPSKMIVS